MARRAHAADRDVSQSFPQPLDDDVELKRQAFQRFELVFLLFENWNLHPIFPPENHNSIDINRNFCHRRIPQSLIEFRQQPINAL